VVYAKVKDFLFFILKKGDKVTASGQTQSTLGIPAIKESPNLKHQGSGVRICLEK